MQQGSAWLMIGAIVAAGLLGVGCERDEGTTAADTSAVTATVAEGAGDLSWDTPDDPTAAAESAGLPMLGQEELAVHYHAHLDVRVDGEPVEVPEALGIDIDKHLIAPLHTHDTRGIIHIESAADGDFTLGQVFAEWGQPLTARQVGEHAIRPDEELRVYVNGKQAKGDPGKVILREHAQVVVWVGKKSETDPELPADFDFDKGE